MQQAGLPEVSGSLTPRHRVSEFGDFTKIVCKLHLILTITPDACDVLHSLHKYRLNSVLLTADWLRDIISQTPRYVACHRNPDMAWLSAVHIFLQIRFCCDMKIIARGLSLMIPNYLVHSISGYQVTERVGALPRHSLNARAIHASSSYRDAWSDLSGLSLARRHHALQNSYSELQN